MRITIVLPWYDNRLPSGGILNMYGYAKRLAKNGHTINIIYDCCKGKGKLRIPNLLTYEKRKKKTISNCCLYKKNNIQEIPVYCVSDNSVPDADFVIATALITVDGVKNLSEKKGKKIYFIQGYENWGKTENEIFRTYDLGMVNITVSKWLYNLVKEHSRGATFYLPNAIDDSFYLSNPIQKRKNRTIAFMYVPIKAKGTYDLLKAIDIVHKKYPDVLIEAFGIYPNNNDIPKYVKYTYCPSRTELRNLYNRCAIFVCASWLEGFGLTAGESMKCGCCLVTTNNKGILDFSVDHKTALVCEPRNVEQLADKICYIMENNEERMRIAKEGEETIRAFSWKNNIEQLERILTKI